MKKPIRIEEKSPGDPVTVLDRSVDTLLRHLLPRDGEGWLSEETEDNERRLQYERVWVVDPIDGTREFVKGIPEWCVSIGLVENGVPVAGGVANPTTGAVVLGSLETGVYWCGAQVEPRACTCTADAIVLASRNEIGRGEWDWYEGSDFCIKPMGSAAWKLAQIAAGRADATWTFAPRHEWDIAAGVALIAAARGSVTTPAGDTLLFNKPSPKLMGFSAFTDGARELFAPLIARRAAAIGAF